MSEGSQSRQDGGDPEGAGPGPAVAVCRTCPGRLVFIESDNTDGWIATDAAVDVTP